MICLYLSHGNKSFGLFCVKSGFTTAAKGTELVIGRDGCESVPMTDEKIRRSLNH